MKRRMPALFTHGAASAGMISGHSLEASGIARAGPASGRSVADRLPHNGGTEGPPQR